MHTRIHEYTIHNTCVHMYSYMHKHICINVWLSALALRYLYKILLNDKEVL